MNWLKGELDSVLPVLTDGHKLVAQEQHGAYGNSDIALYWQQSFKTIDDGLAQAVADYQAGDYQKASQSVQQAHYQGFKNSEMEISVRQNCSSQQAASINQQFSALIVLTAQPDQMSEVAYRVTTLLQDIEDVLPGLPTTRDDQPVSAALDSSIAGTDVPDADWASVVNNFNQAIAAAIAQYESGQAKPAIMAVQDAYFDLFEASGMENKVGSRDSAFKSTLEGYFTRLVSMMSAGQPVSELHAQADAMQQDFG